MIARITLAALAAAAPAALAQTADLTVQTNESSANAEICIDPPGLGVECDSDGSSISGNVVVELDDYGAPGAISLYDYDLVLDQDLSYNMDWGFVIGGIDITLTSVTVTYPTPGVPTGPVAVDGAGDFEFIAVDAIMTGTGSYEGYGPVIGSLVGSGEFNLADFGVVQSAIAGNVTVFAEQVILEAAQAFSQSGEISGVNASIDGTANMVAIGDVPEEDCYADFNGDDVVDTRDVLAYLNAWNAGDAAADCDQNGAIDTRDVLCFLNLWNAGC